MPFLEVAVLGYIKISLDGNQIIGFKTNKARALLTYLMVEQGQPHSRETLAGLLWPDLPDATALSNLRDVLSNLRQLLGEVSEKSPRGKEQPFFLITRSTIQFNPACNYWLDIQVLTEAISKGSSLEALEQAISLYRGNFGEGLLLKKSTPFDEWILVKREQISRLVHSALQLLADGYEARHDYRKVMEFAQKQLEIEPWREEAHRQLMRSQALSGERNQAIMQYENCRRLLWDELGIEPESETTELYQSIRNGSLFEQQSFQRVLDQDKLKPLSYATPSTFMPKLPFVARTTELSSLQNHLRTALGGSGKVSFITGDVGSGKTALALEFSRQSMEEYNDLVVVFGQCNAQTGIGDPYLPFMEILQLLSGDIENQQSKKIFSTDHAKQLWALIPITAQALIEDGPGLIGTFIPARDLCLRAEACKIENTYWWKRFEDLVKSRMDVPPGETGPELIQQTDLFRQVTRVLQHISREHPLLLILDDLQWADPGTLSLLFHLGRRLEGCRILILGVYRSTDVAIHSNQKSYPLEWVIHEFQRIFGDDPLNLDEAERREFVNAYLNIEPNRYNDEFREMLLRRTKGNPLFTIELIRGLQERGDLIKGQSGEWIESGNLDWEKLPRRVEAVIAERFRRLPETWVSILRTGAVEGETFTAEVVARIEHQDENEVIRDLSGPLSTNYQIVHAENLYRLPTGQRLSRYRFGHTLYQKYLYNQLDKVRTKYLHERIGNTLEGLYGDQAHMIAGSLARHYEQAGMPLKAVECLLVQSRKALLSAVNGEATSLFRKGLDLLKELPDTSEKLQLELHLQMGLSESLVTSHGWGSPERAQAVERELLLYQKVNHRPSLEQLLHVMYSQIDILRAQGDQEHSLTLAKDFYRLGQAEFKNSESKAYAHFILGESLFLVGECEPARLHLEQALALYGSEEKSLFNILSIVELEVMCLSWLAMALWGLGYPDQALQRGMEALKRAERLESHFGRAFALTIAETSLRVLRGEEREAETSIRKLLALKQEHLLGTLEPWVDVFQGWLEAHGEDIERSIQLIQKGIEDWQAQGAKVGLILMLVILIDVLEKAGKIDQAMYSLNEAKEQMEKTGQRLYEAELYRLSGKLILHGDPDDPLTMQKAADDFLKAITIARKRQLKILELRATVNLAQLLLRQGHCVDAREILSELYGWFTEGFDTPDLIEAKKLLEEFST